MDEIRFQRAIDNRDGGDLERAYHEMKSMIEEASNPTDKLALLLNIANCLAPMGRLENGKREIQQARRYLPIDDRTPRQRTDFLDALVLAVPTVSRGASAFKKLLGDYADLVSAHEEHDLWVYARERLGLALVSARQFEDTISILGELLKRGRRSTKNTSLSGHRTLVPSQRK